MAVEALYRAVQKLPDSLGNSYQGNGVGAYRAFLDSATGMMV
ncbi:hypothetical protein F11_16970 [Rhodospirillum rubrum F11]|nr:hypothetical protein F11_16970 [Rhodospirillum rubrum F11]